MQQDDATLSRPPRVVKRDGAGCCCRAGRPHPAARQPIQRRLRERMGVGDCPALSANLGRNYRAYNQERPGNTGSNTDRQNHSGISRPDS